MCLIIKKPAGRSIPVDFLSHVWEHNSDGWGSFHVLGGRLFSAKGMHFDDMLAHNAQLPEDVEVYLHLRKATYGHIHHDLAHPYVVRDSLMLMHNGTIHHMAPSRPCMSDSAELAQSLCNMLDGLSEDQATIMLRSEGFARVTAPLVDGSMVVLHDRQGAVRLGRAWHVIQTPEWDHVMSGIEVSNTHAWRPRNRAEPSAWQKAVKQLRQQVQGWTSRPVTQRATPGRP